MYNEIAGRVLLTVLALFVACLIALPVIRWLWDTYCELLERYEEEKAKCNKDESTNS
jgi:hypothetical protein